VFRNNIQIYCDILSPDTFRITGSSVGKVAGLRVDTWGFFHDGYIGKDNL
jgi:hypothetical protein